MGTLPLPPASNFFTNVTEDRNNGGNGGRSGMNVVRALDAWEPACTHLPFSGICYPNHRTTDGRRQPQKPPGGLCARSWRDIHERLSTNPVLSSSGQVVWTGGGSARALLLRAGVRYNRGARKAQKKITVGWAKPGAQRRAVRLKRALRGVFPGLPIYLIQVRDDGPDVAERHANPGHGDCFVHRNQVKMINQASWIIVGT